MRCICGKEAKKGKISVKVYGIDIGEFEGYKCECGEEWFDEKTVDEIEKRSMELGIFGLGVKEKVSASGNSLIIRVPKKLAEFLNIKKGSSVYIEPEGKDKIKVDILQ